jgi:hypothetical protein
LEQGEEEECMWEEQECMWEEQECMWEEQECLREEEEEEECLREEQECMWEEQECMWEEQECLWEEQWVGRDKEEDVSGPPLSFLHNRDPYLFLPRSLYLQIHELRPFVLLFVPLLYLPKNDYLSTTQKKQSKVSK